MYSRKDDKLKGRRAKSLGRPSKVFFAGFSAVAAINLVHGLATGVFPIWFGLVVGISMIFSWPVLIKLHEMFDAFLPGAAVQKLRTPGKRSTLSPERLGQLFGFLVPRKTRKECFEPYFEDLKADRLDKLARSDSRGMNRWIEFCFYFRLIVTVVQSLGCYLGETFSKLAPFIRSLFFKGGS